MALQSKLYSQASQHAELLWRRLLRSQQSAWQAVVQNLNFQLSAGQIVGLVGESGSGKTLTAKALLGLLPQSARYQGRIELHQEGLGQEPLSPENLNNYSEAQWRQLRGRRLAMIFQDPLMALNPLRRVGSQLMEVLQRYQKQPKAQARTILIEALQRVRLQQAESVLRAYPHQLSGGMRQRVMIAMALLGRPQVLIADEPTAALDPTSRDSVLAELRRACEDFHCAVLLISHDLNVVERICDRVLMLYAGRLLEQGPAQQVLSSPQHRYTQALLASRPQWSQLLSNSNSDSDGDTPSIRPLIPVIKGQFSAKHRDLPGCVFAPRCAHAQLRCQQQAPDWRVQAEHDLAYACHFPAAEDTPT